MRLGGNWETDSWETAAEMRFAEGSKVHTVTTQVMDKKHTTPILGMDFWQPHNATFDIKRNTITIESEEENGSLTVEEITCWCEKGTRRAQAAVALEAQIQDLHKAHSWISDSMQQHTLAGDGQSSAARQVSTCQLREITDTITELKGQESQQVKEVKTMLNTTHMEAICYATEDIHVPAGKRLEKAATAAIDMPLDQLHCAMLFDVEGIPRIAIADSDYSGSGSDDSNAPELISESESESYISDNDSDDENSGENTLTAKHLGQQQATPTPAVLTATTEEIKS